MAYSRSQGAYAGLTLEGSLIQPDESANTVVYGRGFT